MSPSIRLNKYLASLGVASRRGADTLIENGQVEVNNLPAKLGAVINPQTDQVTVNGKPLKTSEELEYHLVYKPVDYISTVSDPHHNLTVTSLVKTNTRLYPVGRLDQDSEGLIILTNDGDLTYKLTHPKYHVSKVYEVVLEGKWSDQKHHKLKTGVRLKDGLTSPTEVKVLNLRPRRTLILMTLYEGKNRQIRRMAAALKLEVTHLKRIAIGPLTLGDLKPGESRPLTQEEIKELTSALK